MVTIKEIALKTNYSSSTVSRVLNHDPSLSVSQETRQKIINIAKELGYQTVNERRNKQKSMAGDPAKAKVGILMCHSVEEELNDSYFLSIRQGVESECKKRGVETTELFRLNNLQGGQLQKDIKHLIVVGRVSPELLNQFSNQLENIVYINHSPDESHFDSIAIDFEKATRQAVCHLLELGFRKIGYIGGQEFEIFSDGMTEFEEGRRATFQKIMEGKGMFDPDKCLVGVFTIADGYRLMKKSLQSEDIPDAIFAASDAMAMGAMRAIQEHGLKIPEDIAIVGFNDIELAKYASTPLTTVRVETEEMGRLGVKLMIDRMEGRKIPLKVVVPTELVIRESCGGERIPDQPKKKEGNVS